MTLKPTAVAAKQIVIGPASKKQEMFLNSDCTITLAGGAAGSGKALRHGEKVYTPSGWVNIEDLSVGDPVYTPNNTVQFVTGVYPQGEVQIYKVTFQDGSTVECCGDHLWQYHEARGRGKVKVSTTVQIIERMNKGFRPIVPLTSPLDGTNKNNYKIKPYVLGVLLGDGSISTNSISFTSADTEIVEEVKKEGYSLTEWNKVKNTEANKKAKQYGVAGISQSLRELNLLGTRSGDKFIPNEYKEGSVEDKFALVQGLMDTDGYVDAQGATEYCTVSHQLAIDLQYILRSLGFTVTISEKNTFFTCKGKKKQGAIAYNLYIRGREQNRLFRLTRKKERTRNKNVGNRIVFIEKTTVDYATCISVSGADKLFVTSNFIVTHNTYTSLLIALKFMNHPRATGVIFRKTSKMLTSPGSIWHEAVNLYTTLYPTGLIVRHQATEIVFPNGALLKFSHMQHEKNKYDHKGGQYSLVIFDEATDFSEDQVMYLVSRMRNAYVNYTPQMFLMTNPDFDSFLRLWIQDYYLDSRGIPLPERTGHKRWFYRQGNKMLWYNSEEEARAVHGHGPTSGISTFTFIGANCLDNPPLLKAQPDYLTNLMNLPRVEKERLLDGSWFARPENSGLFKREWCTEVDYPNGRAKRRVRSWDFAFTKPSEINPNPDWTAGVLISKDDSNIYTVEHVVRARDRVHEIEKLIFETAIRDGKSVTITIPQDPAAAAGAYAKSLQRRLAEMGFHVKLCKPVVSKLTRFAPFASLAQAGFIHIVKADWNKDFYEELEMFDGEKGVKKDDQADCCSDATLTLNTQLILPTFSLPTLSRDSSFGYQEVNLERPSFANVQTISLPS